MSTLYTKPLAGCATPQDAIDELCGVFRDYSSFADCCEVVTPEQMPETYRQLLVHNRHMTLVLQEHHGKPINLYVMDAVRDGDFYTRKIFLAKGLNAPAIELGVVRLDLRCIEGLPRQEILQQRTPLGAVLVKHNVFRRIEPRWYLKFPAGSPMLAWMGYPNDGPFYSRIGTIWCNDEPAIELLEIATLW